MSVFGFDPESNWPVRLVPGSNITFRDTGAELIIDSAGGGAGGGVSGSGMLGYVARWTGNASLGAGVLRDDGSKLLVADGTEPAARLGLMHYSSDATATPVYFDNYITNASALGPVLYLRRARGTAASPANVVQSETLGILQWLGYHSGAFSAAAQIEVLVGATPGSGDMPGAIRFLTSADGGSTPLLRMTINHYGTVTLSQQAFSGVSPQVVFKVATGATLSNLTASAEVIDVDFQFGRTVERAAGAVATQRSFIIRPPTFAFVSSSTITTAATVAIEGAPEVGTNAAITTPLAFWIQDGNTLFGAAPLNTAFVAALEVATAVTTDSTRTLGYALLCTSTLTVDADGRSIRGALIYPSIAKSTFTGLSAIGLEVTQNAISGSGTINTWSTIRLDEKTIATANVGICIGTHPGGSTNYSMYINSSNALFLGSGAWRIDGQHSTGANTATFTATNKPGSAVTLTPQTWLKINLGGTDHYIPCWI